MHLCFIEDTPLHGGTQIWVTKANRHFLLCGVDVTILAPQGSWVVEQCAETAARVATYDWDKIVTQNDSSIKIWTDALRDCDVALCTVHPPRQGFHCSVFAARCIREGKLKTHLVAKTGTIVPAYRREFYLPDRTIRSSVVAIADFTRQYLIDTYNIPADKVSLIYQGVNVHRFKSSEQIRREALKRYPLPANVAPILGCIGSFERRKGQPLLLKAVAKLSSGPLPNIHLLLIGDGPHKEMLREKVAAMGLEKRVSMFPFTREPEYAFARTDITVLPSLYKEGLPNVLLESMAMRVPVVASNLGGVPEVVLEGKTGYTVEPGDSDQLADAIYRLWASPAIYRHVREYARRLVKDKFDRAAQFDRFLNHFRRLMQ